MFYTPDRCALCGRPPESFGEQFDPYDVRNPAMPKEAATMYLCKVCIGIIERAPNLTIVPSVQYKVQSMPPIDLKHAGSQWCNQQQELEKAAMSTKEMQDILLSGLQNY